MDAKASIPPGLPHPNPTVSYWQDPPSDIADHCTTASLPATADYLIIGSGISGASIAHQLLSRHETAAATAGTSTAAIVMLEARRACSGATGRNGGHTKAASYRSFLQHEDEYGTAEAVRIARLEHAVIRETHALARRLGIECASTPCETVDIVYTAAHLRQGERAIARMREAMGAEDPAARYEVYGADEARRRFLAPEALGAFKYEAGSLSAYRFTVGLLEACLARGLNLQTNTPALAMTRASDSGDEEPRWVVKTPRGEIVAKQVIVATNGYTAHLLPQMQGLIVPLRGQITAQRPGLGLSQKGLDTTYSFIYDNGYEYMITRPCVADDAGTIIIGGGLGTLPDEGASEFGTTDDSYEGLNVELSEYLTDCTRRYFGSNWGKDHANGRVKREWSGIMGTSADGLPYVGAAQGMEGVWICASFNGHGMVLCLKCGEALVDMMINGEAQDWFPGPMKMEQKRFDKSFRGRLNLRAQVPGEDMFQNPVQDGKVEKLDEKRG